MKKLLLTNKTELMKNQILRIQIFVLSVIFIGSIDAQCPGTTALDTVFIKNGVCRNGQITLGVTKNYSGPNVTYIWQESNDNGLSWGPAGSTADTLNINPDRINQTPNVNNYIYRVRIACGTTVLVSTQLKFEFSARSILFGNIKCTSVLGQKDSITMFLVRTGVFNDNAFVKNYRWMSTSTNGLFWGDLPANKDTIIVPITNNIIQYRAHVSYCPIPANTSTFDAKAPLTPTVNVGLNGTNLFMSDKDCTADSARLSINGLDRDLLSKLNKVWYESNSANGPYTIMSGKTDTFLKVKVSNQNKYYRVVLKPCTNSIDTGISSYFRFWTTLGPLTATLSCPAEEAIIDYLYRDSTKGIMSAVWEKYTGKGPKPFVNYSIPVDSIKHSVFINNNDTNTYRVSLKFCPNSIDKIDTSNHLVVGLQVSGGNTTINYRTCPDDSVVIKVSGQSFYSTLPIYSAWQIKNKTGSFVDYVGGYNKTDSLVVRMQMGLTEYKKSIMVCEGSTRTFSTSTSTSYLPNTIQLYKPNCIDSIEANILSDTVRITGSNGTQIHPGPHAFQWFVSTNQIAFGAMPGQVFKKIKIDNASSNLFYKRTIKLCPLGSKTDTSDVSNILFNAPNSANGKAEVISEICLNRSVLISVPNAITRAGTPIFLWQGSDDEINWTSLTTPTSNRDTLQDTARDYYRYYRRLTMWCDPANPNNIIIDSSKSVPVVYLQLLPWCESFSNQVQFGANKLFNCFTRFSPACPDKGSFGAPANIHSVSSGGKSGPAMKHLPTPPPNPPGIKADMKLVLPAFKLDKGKVYRLSFWHKQDGSNMCWDSLYVTWGKSLDACAVDNRFGDALVKFSYDQWNRYWADFTPPSTGVYYFGIVYRDNDQTTGDFFIDDICIKEVQPCNLATPLPGTAFATAKIIDRPAEVPLYDKYRVTHQYCIGDTIMITYQDAIFGTDEKVNQFDYYGMKYQFYRKKFDPDFYVNDTFFRPLKNNANYQFDSFRNINVYFNTTRTSSSNRGTNLASNSIENGPSAWAPVVANDTSWLEVDLGSVQPVSSLRIYGNRAANEWVTSFKLEYFNGTNFVIADTLKGSINSKDTAVSEIDSTIRARRFRITPLSWVNYPAIRVEFLYDIRCFINRRDWHVTNILATDTNTFYKIVATCTLDGKEYHSDSLKINATHSLPYCEDWSGAGRMQNGNPHTNVERQASGTTNKVMFLDEVNRTASSFSGIFRPDSSTFIPTTTCWRPATNNASEFLQINFPNVAPISGFQVRGNPNAAEWVTNFYLWRSDDGVNFVLADSFVGNVNNTAVVNVTLTKAFGARAIRLSAKSFNGYPAMKVLPTYTVNRAFSKCPTCWATYGTGGIEGFWTATMPWGPLPPPATIDMPGAAAYASGTPPNIVVSADGMAANGRNNTKLLVMPPVRLYKGKGYRVSFKWADNITKLGTSGTLLTGQTTQDVDSLYIVASKGNFSQDNMNNFSRDKAIGIIFRDLQSNTLVTGTGRYRLYWADFEPNDTATYVFTIMARLNNVNPDRYRFYMDGFCIDTMPVANPLDCSDSPVIASPLRIRVMPDGAKTFPFTVPDKEWCNGVDINVEVDFNSPNNSTAWKKGWRMMWERTTDNINWVATGDTSNQLKFRLSYKYQNFRLRLFNNCGKGQIIGPLDIFAPGGSLPWTDDMERYNGLPMQCWEHAANNITRVDLKTSPTNIYGKSAKCSNNYLNHNYGATIASDIRNTELSMMTPLIGLKRDTTYRVSFWYQDHGFSNIIDSVRLGWRLDRVTQVIDGDKRLPNILTNNDILKNYSTSKFKYYTAEIRPGSANAVLLPASRVDTGYNFIVKSHSNALYNYDIQFDDFEVKPKYQNDAIVISIDSPVNACALTNNESVVATVMNLGFSQLSNVPVFCSVDGAPAVSAIIPGPIPSNGTANVRITGVDLSQPGNRSLKVWTGVSNDQDRWDDTLCATIIHEFKMTNPIDTGDTFCEFSNLEYAVNTLYKRAFWYKNYNDMYPFQENDTIRLSNFIKDTSFFVSGSTALSYFATPKNFSDGAATANYSNATGFVRFDNVSGKTLRLKTVTMYSESAGSGNTISITQYGRPVPGCLPVSVSFPKQGRIDVAINWDIPPGTDYLITYTGTTKVLRYTEVNWFGKGIGNRVAIKQPTATDFNYNYFFNMEFRDMGCETDRIKVDFKVKKSPIVMLKDTNRICSYPEYKVCAQAPSLASGDSYTYLWQDGSTDTCIVVSKTNNYKVIVTNQFGCKSVDSTTIIVDPSPDLDLGNDTFFCQGLNVRLDSRLDSTKNSIIWSNGANSKTTSVNTPGIYSAKAFDLVNFCPAQDTVVVSIVNSPSISLGNDRVFCGNTSNIATGVNLTNLTATWGGQKPIGNGLISTKGNWKYWVEVTHNTTGCKNSDSIWANLQSNPSLELGSDINSCGPSEVLKNNLSNTGTYNYVWSTTATTPTLTVSLPGTYRMTMTDALYGCASEDSVKVLFNALPVFSLGNDVEVCQDSFILTAPLTGTNYTYKWTGGATTTTLKVKNTGDYCLTISNGCLTYTDCIRVNLMKNAGMYFDSLPDFKVGCNQATLIATSNLSNNRIRWSNGATTNSIIVNQSGSYSASISGVCGNLTKSVLVQIDKSPTASFNIQIPNVDDSLTILCVNLSSVGANYYWEFGDTKTSSVYNAVHTYSNEGSYLVTLRVKNSCGEKSFSLPTGMLRKKTIGIVENLKELNLNLYPNPANATTKLFASGIQNGKYTVSMSNVLGQVVYSQEVDIKNNLLDHNINVKSIAAGEYLINLVNDDNQSIVRKLIVTK
jgi:hypothetical protein